MLPGWRWVSSCGACDEKGEACQVRYAYNLGFLAGVLLAVGGALVIGILVGLLLR